jgi:hypothetical protein
MSVNGISICPLVPYFPTSSTINSEKISTFEKIKSLCTILQDALTF